MSFAFGAFSAFSPGAIVDYAAGKPLSYWSATVDITNNVNLRWRQAFALYAAPAAAPSPEAIISAYRRGYLGLNDAHDALRVQGVNYGGGIPDDNFGHPERGEWYDMLRRTWQGIARTDTATPSPDTISALYLSGRMDRRTFDYCKQHVAADWGAYGGVIVASGNVATESDVVTQWRLGKIDDQEFYRRMKKLGWYDASQLHFHVGTTSTPGLNTLIAMYQRGMMEVGELNQWLAASGYPDDAMQARLRDLANQLPSPSDIVQFAVRDVWNNDVVARWGYDEEMPFPITYWLGQMGYDWGENFESPEGEQFPLIPWPQAFWRSHWAVISPSEAYQAYRRLRPERLHRYAADINGLTSFTFDDLKTVLKVHDYPPAARGWLAAISSQPLRMLQIRRTILNRTRNRQWGYQQLRDLGYVHDDAEVTLDSWERDDQLAKDAWMRKLQATINHDTYKEILAGYRDGFVDRPTAMQRFLALGIADPTISRALDVVDSQELRASLREYLRAMRKDYLAGEMSDEELSSRLQQARITPAAAQRYVGRWVALRTLERRSLSVGNILSLVKAGLMLPQSASVRLSNLGVVAGDIPLMLAQAEAGLARSIASARKAQLADSLRQRKALEVAQKQASASLRQAESVLRQRTPLASLKQWYALGIRSAPWITLRMRAMGYTDEEIQAYLTQWVDESSLSTGGIGKVADAEARALKKQTPLATIKRWYQYGYKPRTWVEQRLAAIGYGAEAISTYVKDWGANLPKSAPGPQRAPEQTPPG